MFENMYFFNESDNVVIVDIYTRKVQKFTNAEMAQIGRYIKYGKDDYIDEKVIDKWLSFFNKNNYIKVKEESQEIYPVIIPTYKCNYSCDYCYQRKIKNIDNVMSKDMVRNIDLFFDKYCDFFNIEKKYGNISIIGGEPLLDCNKETIQEIINTWGNNKTIITTNGVNIIDFKNMFEEKQIEFHISLDGVKDIHFKRRHAKEEYYTSTLQGIDWALKCGKNVVIMSVFDEDNLEYYSDFFDMLEEIGWLTNEKLKLHINLEIQEGCDSVTLEQLESANKALEKLVKQDNRILYADISSFVPGIYKLKDMLNKNLQQSVYRCSCLGTPNYAFLPNGKVLVCSMAYNEKAIIGSFYPEVEVDFEKIIEIKKRNIINMEKCNKCNKVFLCRGGCLATALCQKKDVHSPVCSVWNSDKIFEYYEKWSSYYQENYNN